MTRLSRRAFALAAGTAGLSLAAPGVLHAQSTGRLVVIGGGFGGASAARYARIAFPRLDVTLIEPKATFVTCPYGNLLLAGERTLPQITHSYDGLKARGVRVVQDWADGIDATAKTVRLRGGQTVPYDKLILSPGIAIRWNAIEGYNEAAAEALPHAWVPGAGEQTTLLRRQLEALPDGGVVGFAIPPNPFRCPPGPYERISMVASYLKKHKPRAKIIALDAKDAFSKQGLFQDAWNELYPGMIEWVPLNKDGRVTKVDAREKVFETELGTRHKVDVGNVIPPQSAAKIAIDAGLTNETGWVPVNPLTFESVRARDIHVFGDANIGQVMPKSGYIANSTSKVAVAAAAAALEGRPAPGPTVYFNTCYSHVGDEYGISVVGVFRPTETGFAETPNSGGVSPRGPLAQQREQRRLEALYADAWYASITKDAFS
ncbi:NAD(P)/FAD-dependent oxidoreductase [Phreatobacter oligotrophus]|uniref:Sulfide dehydrogenase (Flavocytochrome c) flavoprotein subunit n=1 Tax=Phreatobacter oligotrophus TaxID=1122261 RepID=A0A2T4YYS7_9HYPH|nr:NAD(P)/FAD-dependent oxidoreductase [Phreatobacter oligotrophus]PTM51905.1 sulfide dehydrogenase (flavocytochrome c) flavoprotein subunit [Phreatobacter oligotrophus]